MVDVLRSSTKLKYGDVASITTTEKAVAMAFPELVNHVSSESSGSRTESQASFLDLSNDSTYYGDAYFVSIAYDGSPSTVSVESSTGILIPPNSCDDASYSGADSVYTSSSYSKNENEAKFYSHGTNETIEGSNLRDQALLFPTPSAATVVTSKTASPSSSNEMATSEKSPELGVWEKVLLAVVALVIVSCCIVTTIFIVRFMKTKGIAASAKFISSSSLNNASIVPTIRTSNDERFNQIQDWLSGTFDAIPGTPQYDAVAWMANIDIPSILGNDIQKPSHMTDVNRTVNGESDLLIRITQRYALLVIYFAVIGIDNLALGGWASLTGARLPECIWPGITCYTDKSTNTTIVSGLDLNPTVGRVAGSLPTELGLLSNLESLVLTDNSLTGALPSNLYSLSNLRTLRISNNTLSMSLSSNVGGLTNLRFLELSQSAFKDALPTELGLLTDLQFLNLEGNYFSGTIPTELGKLELLENISFRDNLFHGTMPETICTLSFSHRLLNLSADCELPCFQGTDFISAKQVTCDCCTVCY